MKTFNEVLLAHGLDPARVLLLRHRLGFQAELFVDAMNGSDRFASFQDIQGDADVLAAFRAAKHIASFVLNPTQKDVLFAGLWDRLEGEGPALKGMSDGYKPLTRDGIKFSSRRRNEFEEYRGRLVIKWTARDWWQRADAGEIAIEKVKACSSKYMVVPGTKLVWEDMPRRDPKEPPRPSSTLQKILAVIEANGGATFAEIEAATLLEPMPLLRWENEHSGRGFTMDAAGRVRVVG